MRGGKVLMGIGLLQKIVNLLLFLFRFARPSRASTLQRLEEVQTEISTHKALAGLDAISYVCNARRSISTHKALAGLDAVLHLQSSIPVHFNPQGTRGPRHTWEQIISLPAKISTHKALAGLDSHSTSMTPVPTHFNPQGPRGPRRKWTIS